MATQELKLINPFRHPENPLGTQFEDGERLVARITGSEWDEKNKYFVPVVEFIDLVEEIKSCKDMCGMTLMRSMLATGKAKPEDFYDSGANGIDTAVVPESVHDAVKAANESSKQFAAIASALGIEEGEALTAGQLEKALAAFVQKQYEAAQAQSAPAASEVKTNE